MNDYGLYVFSSFVVSSLKLNDFLKIASIEPTIFVAAFLFEELSDYYESAV